MKVLLSVVGLLICLLLGAGVGSVSIAPADQLAILSHKLLGSALPERVPAVLVSILWTIRLPRVLTALLTGAALAVSGTVMQSVLRNPLASSYTLGVSSGASLGAALVMLSGFSILGRFTLPASGFLFGACTVLLALRLTARFDQSFSSQTIVLTGMVLSLFVSAILALLTTFAGDRLKQLVFWQMGSFSGQTWENVRLIAPIPVVCLALLLRRATEMDLLTFGDEQAQSSGVPVRRVKLLLLLLSTLLSGSVVAFVGVIGFVDLIAPHAVRRLFGSRHRLTLPMSAVYGGGFMVLCDLLSRTLLAPRELPVGAITALVGAPFFAWLFLRGRREG